MKIVVFIYFVAEAIVPVTTPPPPSEPEKKPSGGSIDRGIYLIIFFKIWTFEEQNFSISLDRNIFE